MKSPWSTISSGLDQLWFSPFVKDESAQDRADAVDTFIQANGWTWDEVIEYIAKEPLDGSAPVCQ